MSRPSVRCDEAVSNPVRHPIFLLLNGDQDVEKNDTCCDKDALKLPPFLSLS